MGSAFLFHIIQNAGKKTGGLIGGDSRRACNACKYKAKIQNTEKIQSSNGFLTGRPSLPARTES